MTNMTPEELAESVKRLRDIYACHGDPDPDELMLLVNALVHLVGEINSHIYFTDSGFSFDSSLFESIRKSTLIAQLAKDIEDGK